jgi:hypothetical protein
VPSPAPDPPRRFTAPDGTVWEARVVSTGRTSPYLARRLARPVVQFRRVDAPSPTTYAPLPGTTLAGVSAEALVAAWRRARRY